MRHTTTISSMIKSATPPITPPMMARLLVELVVFESGVACSVLDPGCATTPEGMSRFGAVGDDEEDIEVVWAVLLSDKDENGGALVFCASASLMVVVDGTNVGTLFGIWDSISEEPKTSLVTVV